VQEHPRGKSVNEEQRNPFLPEMQDRKRELARKMPEMQESIQVQDREAAPCCLPELVRKAAG
jgi:hypothetical protein